MFARVQENLNRLRGASQSADGRIEPIEINSSATQSQDENVLMEAWINDYLNEVIANQNNYVTELEAIDYFGLLDGERIRTDSNLAESSFILNRARAIIDKYEQLNEEVTYAAGDNIQTLNISESSKRGMKTGYDNSLQRGLDSARKIWSLERQIVSITEKIVVFVDSVDANWTWEDEQFIFINTKNLEIFNAFIAEV